MSVHARTDIYSDRANATNAQKHDNTHTETNIHTQTQHTQVSSKIKQAIKKQNIRCMKISIRSLAYVASKASLAFWMDTTWKERGRQEREIMGGKDRGRRANSRHDRGINVPQQAAFS